MSPPLKWVFSLQIKFLQKLCLVQVLKYIMKHIQWKHLNQIQKIHIEKHLWILTFQKSIQMATCINNDIFNKKINLHFDQTTCGKVLSNK